MRYASTSLLLSGIIQIPGRGAHLVEEASREYRPFLWHLYSFWAKPTIILFKHFHSLAWASTELPKQPSTFSDFSQGKATLCGRGFPTLKLCRQFLPCSHQILHLVCTWISVNIYHITRSSQTSQALGF